MRGTFTFDLTRATSGDTVNPFVESQPTQSSGAAASSNGAASSSGATSSNTFSTNSSSDFGSNDQSSELVDRVTKAHGVVMGLAFVVLFPLGALLMRLFSFRGLVWVHAGNQILTYSLAIAGLGMGIWIANETSQVCIATLNPPSNQ